MPHMGQLPELDPFQHDTLRFLDTARGRAVVADPMGARKTGTVLAWLQGERDSAVVVAPTAVHGHWAREAVRFYPEATVLRVTGPTSKLKRLALLDQVIWSQNPEVYGAPPCIYITTYESAKADQHHILTAGFDAVVFDEGHKLKGRTTQVAKSANATARTPHCVIVTGTPVVNHAEELWQYLHMLAPKVYPSFWKWAETHYEIIYKYYQGRNSRPVKIIGDFLPGHEEIVRNQIEPFFIQRKLEDLFPLEPWIAEPDHVEVPVDLSPAERKVYDHLVKFKWGIVGGKDVTTQNALDLNTRLMQITSDWGTLDTTGVEGSKAKATVDLTLDLIEREEKVVIFCKYVETVKRISQALLKHDVVAVPYTGSLSQETRDDHIHAFAYGDAQVIVGTLDSMSEGLDGLQHASRTAIFVDRHWTSVKNDQAIGRLRRSGQRRAVQVFHIFANDTIDATVTAACLRKTNVINLIKGQPLVDSIYGRTP